MLRRLSLSLAGMCIILFCFAVDCGYAFRQADLDKLRATNKCPGCDLSYADLSSENLSHADLSYANLTYANLSYAYPSGANLSHADLSHANLIGAFLFETNLTDAILAGADFSYAIWTDGQTICKEGSIGTCNK